MSMYVVKLTGVGTSWGVAIVVLCHRGGKTRVNFSSAVWMNINRKLKGGILSANFQAIL